MTPTNAITAEQSTRSLGLGTLLKNSGAWYLSGITLLALGSLTKILLARSLTPVELGLLITGQTVIALASTLGQLSIPDALLRFIGLASHPRAQAAAGLARTSLRMTLGASGLVVIAIVACASTIANSVYHQIALSPVLVILSFAIPLSTTAAVLAAAYQGLGSVWERIVFIDLVPGVFVVAALVILKAINQSSLSNIAGVYVAAAAISAALAVYRFKTDSSGRVATRPAAPVRALLRFSLPLLASGLIAWPMTFIPLILGVRDVGAVAYYSLAVGLSGLIYAPVSAAESVAVPVWSSQIARGQNSELRSDYASVTSWCLILGSIIFAVLILCPEAAIGVMYGTKYLSGANTLRWVAPAVLLNAATGPNESILKALGETRWIFITRLCCGIGVIAATIIWRTDGGLIRALWSFWLSAILSIVLYSSFLLVRKGIHPWTRTYAKSWAAILVSLAFAGYCRQWIHLSSQPEIILFTVGVYSVMLVVSLLATGYLTSKDAAKLRTLIQGGDFFGPSKHTEQELPAGSG